MPGLSPTSGLSANGVTYATDASGNITGLAGYPNQSTQNKIVLLGDSITARNYQANASQNQYDGTGYFTWANALLSQRFLLINEAGVSGNSLTAMAARVQTEVLAYKPNYCLLMGGINDAAGSVAYTTSKTAIDSIVSAVLGAGITLILCTATPSTQLDTATKIAALYRINNYYRQLAQTYTGIILADTYAAWADPDNDGQPASGMTSDGTHPTYLGAANLGRALFEALQYVVPVSQYPQSQNSLLGNTGNLVRNGMLSGNNASGANGYVNGTAGNTGTGPNNWATSRTGTAASVSSKVARTDWRAGNLWRLAMTGGSNQDRIIAYHDEYFQSWSSGGTATAQYLVRPTVANGCNYRVRTSGSFAAGADPTASWSTTLGATFTDGTATLMVVEAINPGDYIYGQCRLTLGSFSAGAQARINVRQYDSNPTVLWDSFGMYADGSSTLPTYIPPSAVLRTPDSIVLPTCVQIRFYVEVFGTAGVTGNIDIGEVEIRKSLVSTAFSQ